VSLGPLLDRLGRAIGAARWRALAVVLLVTAAVLVGAGRRVAETGVPVDFTPQAIFLDAGEEVDTLRRIERSYGREDNDLVCIVEGDIGTAAGLDYLRRLEAALAQHGEVERVDSILTATVLDAQDGMLTVSAPVEDRSPAGAVARLAEDAVWQRLLVSEDGDTTALRVRLDRELERIGELGPVVSALGEIARAVERPPGTTLKLTGVPWVRTEVVDRMMRDQATFVPALGLIFSVVVCLLFRRVWLGLAPLLGVGFAAVWAVGLLVAGGATLNILSVLVPTLVLVIGVADGIHITARYREELARGDGRPAALGRTLQVMGLPCFLTTFTTAAGFASLVVAQTRVIRDFGMHSAVAMVVCFAAVLLAVPTLLAFVPEDRVAAPSPSRGAPEERLLLAVDGFVRGRPLPVLLGCLALTALLAGVGSQVRANSRLLEMYREGSATWTAIKTAERELSGVIPVFVHVESDDPGAFSSVENLRRIDALEQQLRTEDMVLWTRSLASTTRMLHHALTEEDGLPPSREALAQELLLAELAGAELLDGLTDEARIMAIVADAGGRETLAMKARTEQAMAQLFEGTELRGVMTGDGMLAAAGVDRLITDLLASLALVFVVIAATLALLLRDLRLALVACVPNVVPLVFTLATLGLMGADLQTSNIVTFTVALGLAVDDTIHFIVRYRQERLPGNTVQHALTATTRGAGHAIVLTSLLLVSGFALLATSELTSTRHFGILSSVTMGAALLGDLLLLPALLHLVEQDTPA
jgi:predicted RND superfamily exporter protein